MVSYFGDPLLHHRIRLVGQLKPNCPYIVLWQGCANVQRRSSRNTRPHTETWGGEQSLPALWVISLPKNAITMRAMRTPGIRFLDIDPNSIWYESQFVPQGEPSQNTNIGCYLSVESRKEGCDECDLPDFCANVSADCRNGVVVTFDPEGGMTLIDFLNQQSPGTTVCLEDGDYVGGQVVVDFLIIKKAEDDDVITFTPPLDVSNVTDVVVDI